MHSFFWAGGGAAPTTQIQWGMGFFGPYTIPVIVILSMFLFGDTIHE